MRGIGRSTFDWCSFWQCRHLEPLGPVQAVSNLEATSAARGRAASRAAERTWIWIDFENTPHVLFLEPFIQRLNGIGVEVRVTAKPQSQTLELSAARGLC